MEHPPEPLRDVLEKWQNFGSNPSFWWLFRPKILIFAMLTHVLPCGSLSGEARRDPENIFPNIEDGRVFWVKRNMPRPFVAGKWKMRFYKPNGFRTPSDRFEYPFTYLNQGGTTQNGCATNILAPGIRHSKNDKNDKNDVKMIYPKFIQNRSQEVPGPSGHQKTSQGFSENILIRLCLRNPFGL